MKYYRALYDLHISVDIVEPTADLSKYKIVIAPLLYMVSDDSIANIEKFVGHGGTLITTFFSGIVDENDIVRAGGYPGAFRELLGIWVEEVDALYPDMKNEIKVEIKNEISIFYRTLATLRIHRYIPSLFGLYRTD